MSSTPLTGAWIAVQAASAKEQSAALVLSNSEGRSQRARLGLTAQHDAALAELDVALKVLALAQASVVELKV
jgi:hypothetical protein